MPKADTIDALIRQFADDLRALLLRDLLAAVQDGSLPAATRTAKTPKPTQRKASPAATRAVRMHALGANVRDIAKELGKSPAWVRALLHNAQ